MNFNNRNVTPEKAQQILLDNSAIVSIKEAERMLRKMYDFATIAVKQLDREMKAASLKKKRKPKNI